MRMALVVVRLAALRTVSFHLVLFRRSLRRLEVKPRRSGSAEMTLVTSASKSISDSRICGAWRFRCATTCASVFFLAMRTSEMEIAIVLGLSAAEAAPSVATSASCYDQIEYVRIFSVAKPELKFVQVQGQVCLADFVIAAHDTALEIGRASCT